jgi:hypothetical protein
MLENAAICRKMLQNVGISQKSSEKAGFLSDDLKIRKRFTILWLAAT